MPYSFNKKKAFSPPEWSLCAPGGKKRPWVGSSFPPAVFRASQFCSPEHLHPCLFQQSYPLSSRALIPCHPELLEAKRSFLCARRVFWKKILRRCAPQDDKKRKVFLVDDLRSGEVFLRMTKKKGSVSQDDGAEGKAATRRPKLVFPVFPATRYGIARKMGKPAFFSFESQKISVLYRLALLRAKRFYAHPCAPGPSHPKSGTDRLVEPAPAGPTPPVKHPICDLGCYVMTKRTYQPKKPSLQGPRLPQADAIPPTAFGSRPPLRHKGRAKLSVPDALLEREIVTATGWM